MQVKELLFMTSEVKTGSKLFQRCSTALQVTIKRKCCIYYFDYYFKNHTSSHSQILNSLYTEHIDVKVTLMLRIKQNKDYIII